MWPEAWWNGLWMLAVAAPSVESREGYIQGSRREELWLKSSFMLSPCRSKYHRGKMLLTTASSVRSFLLVLSVICCGTNTLKLSGLKQVFICWLFLGVRNLGAVLVVWLWIRVSPEMLVVKLLAGLGLDDLLSRWLTWVAVNAGCLCSPPHSLYSLGPL